METSEKIILTTTRDVTSKGFLRDKWLRIKMRLGMWLLKDTPLLYTTRGNVPVEVLTWTPTWEITELAITFVDRWLLDGEIVKEGRSVLGKVVPPDIGVKQANLH